MELLAYIFAFVVVVVLVFFTWHLWCVAVLKFVNPILDGLNASPVDLRLCGRRAQFSNWPKPTPGPNPTPTPVNVPTTVPAAPIPWVQIGVIVFVVVVLILLVLLLKKSIESTQTKADSDSSSEEQAESKTTTPPFSGGNKMAAREEEDVFFTALYPGRVRVERWGTLLVYAHLQSALKKVIQDAERFKSELEHPRETTSSSATRLARGTEITIIPTCQDVAFNPERISLQWLEDFHRADFRFQGQKSLRDQIAQGQISVYVGPLLVCSINLLLNFTRSAGQPCDDYQTPPQAIYHQDDIFVSYSHKDSKIVNACREAYKALGFNVLIDVETLRSGQLWNDELKAMIKRANIFQLFWSANYSKSEYCKMEWKYALSLRRGAGFIRPSYWRKPLMPPPPKELNRFHFQFMEKITRDK
jgi:hypothetical protein